MQRGSRESSDGVEANARLTASTGAVLLVLLALEGVTIPLVHRLLTPHVVIGTMLLPPVVVKIGSTGYRLARYYSGDVGYREKGPPRAILRLLGPFVVVLTLVVLASGIALLFASGRWQSDLIFVHKASFVLWFGAMTVHVLAHLVETSRLAPRDWYGRTRREIGGANARQWLVVASVAVGVLLGIALAGHVGHYLLASNRSR